VLKGLVIYKVLYNLSPVNTSLLAKVSLMVLITNHVVVMFNKLLIIVVKMDIFKNLVLVLVLMSRVLVIALIFLRLLLNPKIC